MTEKIEDRAVPGADSTGRPRETARVRRPWARPELRETDLPDFTAGAIIGGPDGTLN